MSRAKRILPAAIGALAALGLLAPPAPARVESEIAPPDKRHVSVEKAANLAKQTKAAPRPAEIVQPFAPPGFELTDAEEAAAAAAAARMVAAGTLGNPAGPAPRPPPGWSPRSPRGTSGRFPWRRRRTSPSRPRPHRCPPRLCSRSPRRGSSSRTRRRRPRART